MSRRKGQGKIKARLRQGQPRLGQGQGIVKVRSRQSQGNVKNILNSYLSFMSNNNNNIYP